jgi:hypothetical protein
MAVFCLALVDLNFTAMPSSLTLTTSPATQTVVPILGGEKGIATPCPTEKVLLVRMKRPPRLMFWIKSRKVPPLVV